MQIGPVGIVQKFCVIIEQARRCANALFRRRRNTKFVRIARGVVANLIALVRRIAGVANISVIGSRVINPAITLIIGNEKPDIRIGRVVCLLQRIMVQIGPCIDQAERTKTPVDCP